ncbi:hypothetical protein QJS04_geneDACA006406 [Acorus gramineus]|uniref:Uncharacterized protein n=1 Tax=Acorus gramineus TaxID=55184 RepID=A0AAV9AXV4_ACOGR|nr:hypothetical protein QJS04_geneDACA006406 [Acorus gramineus]
MIRPLLHGGPWFRLKRRSSSTARKVEGQIQLLRPFHGLASNVLLCVLSRVSSHPALISSPAQLPAIIVMRLRRWHTTCVTGWINSRHSFDWRS